MRALVLLVVAIVPATARAHDIRVTCMPRGDRVDVSAFFVEPPYDDRPASAARVEVLDSHEAVIARGTTDAEGKWSFARPGPGVYEIHVDAGDGHRARDTLNIRDDGQATAADTKTTRTEATGFPWLKVLIGLTIIGGCATAWLLARLGRRGT
jgi:hypothetical protein